jgi:TolB-like protein/Tfp pilus assembly protein PilF
MAPEQIQGGEVDARSDIFSYGVLLFEMLTGHLPFRGEHEAATMYAILNEEPLSVLKGCPEAPPEMERIIHRALEKDPADRYQSVADMLSELRRTRKITTGVVRPTAPAPVAEPPPPSASSAGMPPARPRSRVILPAAFGAALFAILLIAYLLTGRHQTVDSIAVLPFENVGGDPNTEYLSDGITESLINTLSKLSHLTVMSRTSVFHYKGKDVDPLKAGKELGVKAVLVGRVTQRGDNLQISTELVDVSNSSHIWGEQYSKKLADILAVQEDIAKEISQQLKVTLVGADAIALTKRSTENTEAYQLYLKGRFHWNKRKAEDLQKAVDYFKLAIDKDPGYALAYAGLASAYILFPEYSSSPAKEYVPRTEAAAKRALELDATLAEPHAALGLLKQTYRWDWKGAEAEYRRAIELNPNYPTVYHWHSICLRAQGKFDEALVQITRAQELDPLSLIIGVNLGEILTYLQRDEQAREQYRKALDLDPNFSLAHLDFGMLLARQGKFDDAISEIQKVRQIVGANNPYGLGHLGFIYARAGRKAEAMAALKELNGFLKEGYSLSVQIAFVYAGLGENDKTFEWLDRGYAEQNNYFRDLKTSFIWENLRSDPRYAAMLKKIGLAE